MGQVWRIAGLGHVERDVLLALADHAHDDGTSARPGVGYLVWKTDWTERAVRTALRGLTAKQIIEPMKNIQGGRGRVTEFVLHLERGQQKPPFQSALKGASDDTKGASDDTKGGRSTSRVKKNHQEPSRTTRTPAAAKKRDELFDTLAIACGFRLDAMTKESSRLCGIAANEIRRAGGSPDMIAKAVQTYRRLYNGAATTPKAIANHWPAIAPRAQDARTAPCPDCGVGGGQHIADCPQATFNLKGT